MNDERFIVPVTIVENFEQTRSASKPDSIGSENNSVFLIGHQRGRVKIVLKRKKL